MEFPYFPFYPRDWMSDPKVQLLDMREEWSYMKLLMMMWTYDGTCTLPNDNRVLSRLLRMPMDDWLDVRSILIDGDQAVFQVDDGGNLYNPRLMAEFRRMEDKSKSARNAADVRWESTRQASGKQTHEQLDADAMQTHSDGIAEEVQAQCDRNALTEPESEPESEPDSESKAFKASPLSFDLKTSNDSLCIGAGEIVKIWNAMCGNDLPRVTRLTELRRRHVMARLSADSGRDEEWWTSYFGRIRASPFCCGDNPRGWRANFDFAVRSEDVVAKVLEGFYDHKLSTGSDGRGQSAWSAGGNHGHGPGKFADLYIYAGGT